jgi:hypothetical protein
MNRVIAPGIPEKQKSLLFLNSRLSISGAD